MIGPDTVTETDIAVASAVYPILVECARHLPAKKLTYGGLIKEAQLRHPNLDAIQNAIPVSLGRRLDVVRMFLTRENLPDLTVLIVNAGTGEVGSAFGADPDAVCAEVEAFDWSRVAEEFNFHLSVLRKSVEARKCVAKARKSQVSRVEAKQMMADYARENRKALPKGIESKREEILDLIGSGASVQAAFARVTGS